MDFSFGVSEICLAAVLGVIVRFYLLSRSQNTKASPPGPMGLPLLGYLPFRGKHAPSKFFELSKKYGPVMSVKFGWQTVIILNDYESINEALVKRADVFSGRPTNIISIGTTDPDKQEGILGRDLTEACKVQRKFSLMTLRNFGFGKRTMEDKITDELMCFLEVIRTKNGEPFDCQALFSKTVSNVICSIIFGSRFSYDDESFCKMVDSLNAFFSNQEDLFSLTLIVAVNDLRHIPPFSRAYKRFRVILEGINDTLEKIVGQHKNTLEDGDSRDFIDEYLKEMKRKGDSKSIFSESRLVQLIRDLFIAGTETTSSTLRWIVLLFAHRPDIQEKLAMEIKTVIGETTPTMSHREKLPYTCAFLHEISRHRTLVPLSVPHKTTEDLNFRGYHIAKNTMVLPNLWAVHHDPKNFDNPLEFKPERFIDQGGKFVQDKRVIPFSIGPRFCLGEQLARMELFLFLTNIVQRFEIIPNASKPVPSFYEGIRGTVEVPRLFEVSFVSR